MANRFDQLISGFEPRLQRAFRESINNIRSPSSLARVAGYIESGDVEGIARELRINPASFRPLDRAISEAYESAGNFTARTVGPPRAIIQFDMRNVTAETWLRNHSGTLVRDITADQRNLISETLRAGMERGQNPRTTALDLVGRISQVTGRREGGAIGLAANQEQWVREYANKLRAGDTAALSYKLRDKRFDAAVRRAAQEGRPLTEAEIQSMVRSYRNRALRYRGETIARTETLTAMNAAANENMRQMIESGQIDESIVTKRWNSSQDERVRGTHVALNQSSVPYRSLFRSPSGALMQFPGDPNAPPEERINCRCWVSFDADFFAGLQ